MSKPAPRSRLNITCWTKIDGTLTRVKLPMRFLVLGDFTAKNETPLAERRVYSIRPGMELKSLMRELDVTAPIEPAELRQSLPGALEGHITGRQGLGHRGHVTVEPYPHALAGITRNLAFVFNTRTTWGVLQGVESGDCEDERKLHQVVEALRAAMLAAVRQYEPRLVGPQVEMRGHHGNRVRFEVHGLVEGKACAIDVDIHSVTGRADVAEVAS